MYDLEMAKELAQLLEQQAKELANRLDQRELVMTKVRQRFDATKNNLKEVENQYETCKKQVAKAGKRAYWELRQRLGQEIADRKEQRRKLLERQRQTSAKMQDLKERGDGFAARKYLQQIHEWARERELHKETIDGIERQLQRMRPPMTGYERWLEDGDPLKVQYEALRETLKLAREEYARAKQALADEESAEKALYEALGEVLEKCGAELAKLIKVEEAKLEEAEALRQTGTEGKTLFSSAKTASGGGVIKERTI